MEILVTGATGYIGWAVAEALKSAGHRVFGLARTQAAAEKLGSAGHHVRAGSLEDLASLKEAARGMDSVIHCAMQFDAQAGSRDRQAVEALLDALAGSDRAFLYTSGVWVYGDTNDRMLGEVAPLNPPPLVAWRPAVEELVRDAAARKVKTMVFRPGMVFGRGGGAVQSWYESARAEKVIRVVGDGQNHWSNVHVEDLAALYRLAAEDPAPGEVFVACSGMPQRVRKLAEAVRRSAGEDVAVHYMPVAEARETMGAFADCLAMDCKAGSTKAARFFGWGPKRPNIVAELEKGG